MKIDELYEEIKILRAEGREDRRLIFEKMAKMQEELHIFKGRAYGFIIAITFLTNIGMALYNK